MERIPLTQARRLAEKIMEELAPSCARIEIAGSIRRGLSTVGDIDLVCLPHWNRGVGLTAAFHSCAMIGGVMLDGRISKRCRLRKSGIQLDLWVAHHGNDDLLAPIPCNWGAMLLTYTGSPNHNIRCVERAKALGMTFRPGHGVIEQDGTVHSLTEEAIFTALQWDFMPPENRI
jgi:DNA polymerase/3'-5' exonuclease PolX